jgi:hypothetical protein
MIAAHITPAGARHARRTRLVLRPPLLGSIALRLELVADPSVPTMAVDGPVAVLQRVIRRHVDRG